MAEWTGPKTGGGDGEEVKPQLRGVHSVGGDEDEEEENEGSRLMGVAFLDSGRL